MEFFYKKMSLDQYHFCFSHRAIEIVQKGGWGVSFLLKATALQPIPAVIFGQFDFVYLVKTWDYKSKVPLTFKIIK